MHADHVAPIQVAGATHHGVAARVHALRTVLRGFPPRRMLFLQGVPGAFMHELGMALAARGHGVLRVNFNGGDWLAWPSLPAVDFRGRAAEWPAFLQRLMLEFAPTDVVLQGDCRPLHMTAIELANRFGVMVHVFEEGYLRPDWITLEIGGVNGHSRLPRDPHAYRRAAERLPELPGAAHVPPRVRTRARDCVRYAAACIALTPFYPHFATHRGWSPLQEAAGWMKRAARTRRVRQRSEAAVRCALDARGGFFVLPIQMDNDSQILRHSDLGGMMNAIRLVVASFARHAPPNTVLAVKEHPLDNGIIDWRKVVHDAARQNGLAERVVLVEACDLQRLLGYSSGRARGMVTVNSTSATFALAAGVPVIALGRSVYDLPGLTHQGTLGAFWRDPSPPDAALFEAFRRVVAHACLIAGDFFTREGVARAVAGAVPRIEAAQDANARAASTSAAGPAGLVPAGLVPAGLVPVGSYEQECLSVAG